MASYLDQWRKEMKCWRSLGVSDRCWRFHVATGAFPLAVIPLHWLLWLGCDQSAATVTIIDSNGLTAAISASAVNPQTDTRMWRKCLVLRSEAALGKPLIIQVDGSADGSAPPGCLFQQWVGSKTNGFNVDSRMQEADEQTEGKNNNIKSGAQEESWGAERGRERSRFMLSTDAEEMLAAKSRFRQAFGIWKYLYFICKRLFGAGWLWRTDKSLWETISPTVCFSIKVKLWARIVVTAHRGATQLFKWIPALLFSVRALKNMTGSSKVAVRAAVTQQRYYTCASCRTAEIIFLAHLNTVAAIQFTAILMSIVVHICWNRWPRIHWQCWMEEPITAVLMQQRYTPAGWFFWVRWLSVPLLSVFSNFV